MVNLHGQNDRLVKQLGSNRDKHELDAVRVGFNTAMFVIGYEDCVVAADQCP